MKIQCPECGKPDNRNPKFCTNCGFKFVNSNSNNTAIIAIVVSILLGSCVFCGIIGAIGDKSNKEKPTISDNNSESTKIEETKEDNAESIKEESTNTNLPLNKSKIVPLVDKEINSEAKSKNETEKITPKKKPQEREKLRTRKSTSGSGNYIRGPRGGCYYINGNGKKTYVDRSLCS